MKLTTALAAGLAAATTAAASDPTIFGVQSILSGSPLQYAAWTAAKNGIWNLRPDQGASCDAGADPQYATFLLAPDGTLNLYKTDNPPQQLYVDRSGMGQGKIGFTTGAEPTPRNAERTGWAVDAQGHLNFAGIGFVACPGYADGAYEIWLAGLDKPAGNEGCVGVEAATIAISEPVGCLYDA